MKNIKLFEEFSKTINESFKTIFGEPIQLEANVETKINDFNIAFFGEKYNEEKYRKPEDWINELGESKDTKLEIYIDFTLDITIGEFNFQCNLEFKSNYTFWNNKKDFEIKEKDNGDKLQFVLNVFGEYIFATYCLGLLYYENDEFSYNFMEKISEGSEDDDYICRILLNEYIFDFERDELKNKINKQKNHQDS